MGFTSPLGVITCRASLAMPLAITARHAVSLRMILWSGVRAKYSRSSPIVLPRSLAMILTLAQAFLFSPQRRRATRGRPALAGYFPDPFLWRRSGDSSVRCSTWLLDSGH